MIHFSERQKIFYLQTKGASYVLKILPDGVLYGVYYGKRVPEESLDYYNLFRERAFSPVTVADGKETSLDCIPQEYPTFGRGDYRAPALAIEAADGRRVCELKYLSHSIFPGRRKMEGLPHLSAGDNDADTLIIDLEEQVLGLTVRLFYTVYRDIDLIARHSELYNHSAQAVRINKAASMSVDFWLKGDYEMINLYGAWARECAVERIPLHHGITSVDSRRGATGHQLNPFLALASPGAGEENGEVYGFSLVYSSDFSLSVERDQFDGLRVQAGINPFNFTWDLKPGETLVTPEALLVYSGEGLGQMSRTFHTACRRFLGNSQKRAESRQIVINSWEAMYFDFNEEKIVRFIESCKGLGIDTFVMDDGWFGRRNCDNCSLGDWTVDTSKLPGGFSRITEACKRSGMRFGLWFEPEMISEDSDLFRTHPDWCIHAPGRDVIKSRRQYILDFSRPEVVTHIYNSISKVLRENDISYVKWDMNRNMTDNGSDALSGISQGEHSHRHILGVYSLMERLTGEFPDILFEGCSGGGGRFDFGILHYMPQIWTSDDSDAIARLDIQYGTSLVYPPACMAAHVSDCPNHQTGRITPFKTRGDVAMLCSFGYELDAARLNAEDKAQIAEQTERRRRLADLIENGSLYRLESPFKGNTFAWQMVSPNKEKAYAVFVRKLSVPNDPGYLLRLKGLDADRTYYVKELDMRLSGASLMYAGLPILPNQEDFSSVTFEITAED